MNKYLIDGVDEASGRTGAIYFGGHISGGHFNPAVSVMMFLNKKIQAQDLLFYILAQVLGGAVALQLYKVI